MGDAGRGLATVAALDQQGAAFLLQRRRRSRNATFVVSFGIICLWVLDMRKRMDQRHSITRWSVHVADFKSAFMSRCLRGAKALAEQLSASATRIVILCRRVRTPRLAGSLESGRVACSACRTLLAETISPSSGMVALNSLPSASLNHGPSARTRGADGGGSHPLDCPRLPWARSRSRRTEDLARTPMARRMPLRGRSPRCSRPGRPSLGSTPQDHSSAATSSTGSSCHRDLFAAASCLNHTPACARR